jgi:HAD superfamily hydrolase (TIGR01484 family)
VRYQLLACDYDGTLAQDGQVSPEAVVALTRLKASGRKLLLATGRELPDLLAIFPDVTLFDWVVAENGGLLYRPDTREETALGAEPPPQLVARLRQKGVSPLSIGRVIIATWEPHEAAVLEAIRELGLDLQVIFNKGAVMALPAGINKGKGVEAALERLRLSAHNCVGVGDAENDHVFLAVCGCAVAVANALPAVKESADWTTSRPRGAGVCELIERLLEDDLRSLGDPPRRAIPLGNVDEGQVTISAFDSVGLIAGASGSGKTSAASGLVEQLVTRGYQVCVIDPEGDHTSLDSAVVAGTADQPPELDQIFNILESPRNHAVVNLLGIKISDRPRFFVAFLTRLHAARAVSGRPHWVVIDEAHHVLDGVFEPAQGLLPADLASALLITVHPERLPASLLARINFAIGVGAHAAEILATLARLRALPPPIAPALTDQPGETLFWVPGSKSATRLRLAVGRAAERRHRRKYAHGALGPDKSFYFRGADEKLNLRAQNLMVFNDIGGGVDDDTWTHHLRQGDYSEWVRDAIKDHALAERIADVERDVKLTASQSRLKIRELIEATYTLPA